MQLEQRRDRNDRALRRDPELVGDILPERLEHVRRQLLRSPDRAARGKLQRVRRPHQTLEFAAGVRGIGLKEAPRTRAHQHIAAPVDADDARRQHAALAVANDGELLAIEDGGRRIAGAQIDADVERSRFHDWLASW
jgi:hypothetical protein